MKSHGIARTRARTQSGFTLVELMVVIVIAAILALVVSSALHRRGSDSDVGAFAHKILIAMRRARGLAADSGAVVQLQFSPDGKAVTIARASFLGPGPPAGSVWMAVSRYDAGTVPVVQAIRSAAEPGVVATPGTGGLTSGLNGVLTFNPDGSAVGATVYVRDDGNQYHHKVVLFGITGYSLSLARW